MKKVKRSTLAKTIAIILFVISAWVTVGSICGIVTLYEEGVYTDNNVSLKENLFDNIIYSKNRAKERKA